MLRKSLIAIVLIVVSGSVVAPAAELAVGATRRYLLKDGEPFFYLCDSGWDLFMRPNLAEANEYLENRADKGFNVIMSILIGWLPHRDDRNAYGEPPLIDKDPARPNEKYFQHVDQIVNKANSLGMFVAIVPAWSDWMYDNVGQGPHPFNESNAQSFGEYVGRRYRDNDIIWVIGGDRNPQGYEDIIRAMVAGLDAGDGDRDFLMTFHGVKIKVPKPPQVYYERLCSASLFGGEAWLDFHGAYSGHQWAYPTYEIIARDRAMQPIRPVIDLEPCYENHAYIADGTSYWANPAKWDGQTRGTAALIRAQAYWAMLAGAAGHTYAGDDVWQFHDPRNQLGEPAFHANTHWRVAMDFPGAFQMGIMRRLFESRPWQTLEPDQSIVVAGQGPGENHVQGARASDGKSFLVYLPRGGNVTVAMEKVSGNMAKAHWFNPRAGTATPVGEFLRSVARRFSAPSAGAEQDWLLVVDDAAQAFGTPGGRLETESEGSAIVPIDPDVVVPAAPPNLTPPVDLDPFFELPQEYRDHFGNYRSPLQFFDGRPVQTQQDWPARRAEIKKAWHTALGPWPPLLEYPRLQILDTKPLTSYSQHKVRIDIAPNGRTVDGYLLHPQGSGPFPAAIVVYYDPETGIGERGARRDFAKQLALRGFVTLSIGTPESVQYYPTKENAQMQPLTSLSYAAANCHAALAQLPYVDGARIGIVGHSYGGKWAMFASCLYDKFACAAWSDGGIVFDEAKEDVDYWDSYYIGYEPGLPFSPRPIPDTVNPSPFVTPTRRSGFGPRPVPGTVHPRTGAYKQLYENGHDLHELHALMAPRPFLVSGGEEDGLERWIPLNHSIAVNKLLGFENRVAMTNRAMHGPTHASNAQLYAFFERFLKHGN